MLNSAIYTGRVFHRRLEQREHQLDYTTFYFLLDLDELQSLSTVSRLFNAGRRAWFSFHEADYGVAKPEVARREERSSLQTQYQALLAEHGLTASRWHFQLLTMPRILGYAFNPISLLYCNDNKGDLRAMIYEVNSTFGERIHYVLPVTDAGSRVRHQCQKEMFVSPFFDLQGHYEFDVGQPLDKLNFCIDYFARDELSLRASFSGRRLDFSASNLRKLAVTKSNTTIKVIAGIHWEAIKLWLKGLAIVNHVPLVNQAEGSSVTQNNGHEPSASMGSQMSRTTKQGACPMGMNTAAQSTQKSKPELKSL